MSYSPGSNVLGFVAAVAALLVLPAGSMAVIPSARAGAVPAALPLFVHVNFCAITCGGLSYPLPALPYVRGSNASGFAAVAVLVPLASLMPAVPLAGAGAAPATDNYPPSFVIMMQTHIVGYPYPCTSIDAFNQVRTQLINSYSEAQAQPEPSTRARLEVFVSPTPTKPSPSRGF